MRNAEIAAALDELGTLYELDGAVRYRVNAYHDAAKAIRPLLEEGLPRPDVVVVDPPRAGLAGKALKRLGELAAPRIVYVSCNPTTLAGDAKRLVEEYGYRLVRTRPVDMFPHTPHVESVSVLERNPSAG